MKAFDESMRCSIRRCRGVDHSDSPGKFIRELALRTESGASIVGIDRDGTNVINPGPDEELKAGDQLLLLGTKGQLDKAKQVLSSVSVSNRH